MRKKLASNRGFSMMELLVAIAVLVILCASLGLVLPATLQSYRDVTGGSEASVLCSTLSEAVAEELRYTTSCGKLTAPLVVSSSGTTGAFTYDSQRFGSDVQLGGKLDPNDSIFRLVVTHDTETYMLASAKSYTSGVTVERLQITAQGDDAYEIKLDVRTPSGQTASSGFIVTRLND